MSAVIAPVARYAARFHGVAGDRHQVASPLGAWLLLALCASASASASASADLEDALGMSAEDARESAEALLAAPHDAVLAAAALWARRGVALDGLPDVVETGDLPTQERLDAWARERTLGLIERFPLTLTPDTLLVLATALATKVSWERPFELAPAADLGGAFADRLTTALRTPEEYGHRAAIAHTAAAGDVAVHTARAREGLAVTSVAATPGVPAADVLAAAHEVAAGGGTHRSLFELPLRDTPLWTLRERRAPTTRPDGREERCAAVLPAWEARGDHNLDRPELGFPAARRLLEERLGRSLDYEARQAAVARYSRVGFEAAAVSAMMTTTSFQVPRDGVVREAVLRFGHPYAVVAVATGAGPWHGVPVFSAWIADPRDAS
ncbi:hypothetical protein WEI85_26335 [Actinomycetes bacterium KLBMP 9797]